MATPKPAPESPAKPAARAGKPDASVSASSSTAESSATHPGGTLDRNERQWSKSAGELSPSDLTLWQHTKMAARQQRDKAVEALCALVAPIKALLPGKHESADDSDGDSETVEGAEDTGKKPAGGKAALLIRTPLSKRTQFIIAAAAVALIALIAAGLRFALKAPPPLPQPAVLEVLPALEEEQAVAKAKQDAERKRPAQQEADKSKPDFVTPRPASAVAATGRENGKIVSEPDKPAKPAQPAQPAAGRAINEQGDCNLVGNVKTIGEVLRRCIQELNGQDGR